MAIAVVASGFRYSSTTKTPAMSAFKYGSFEYALLPMYVADTVLSVSAVEAVPLKEIPFTVKLYCIVDARYVNVIVSHEFCASIPPVVILLNPTVTPFFTAHPNSPLLLILAISILLFGAPLPMSKILS